MYAGFDPLYSHGIGGLGFGVLFLSHQQHSLSLWLDMSTSFSDLCLTRQLRLRSRPDPVTIERFSGCLSHVVVRLLAVMNNKSLCDFIRIRMSRRRRSRALNRSYYDAHTLVLFCHVDRSITSLPVTRKVSRRFYWHYSWPWTAHLNLLQNWLHAG